MTAEKIEIFIWNAILIGHYVQFSAKKEGGNYELIINLVWALIRNRNLRLRNFVRNRPDF